MAPKMLMPNSNLRVLMSNFLAEVHYSPAHDDDE